MFSKIRSSWLALWAGFLHFMYLDRPAKNAAKPSFYTPEELREKLKDRSFQLEAINWIEMTLRPLENDAIFLAVAQNRPTDARNITTRDFRQILDLFAPFIESGTPAHEKGHHIFDALGIMSLISNDPWIARAYRNEIDAAALAGMIHDGLTGVQHRYIDNNWELDHGEIWAHEVYRMLEGLVSQPVRLLTAYFIATHPHRTKDVTLASGYIRRPWNVKIFYYEDRPVRIGDRLTKFTDRLENGGDSACHFTRHALANVDGALVGGLDLNHLDGTYNFSNSLSRLFAPSLGSISMPSLKDGEPVLKDGQPVMENVPSMIQHLKGYADSAVARPYSPYNMYDDFSPNMRFLMDWKIANNKKLIELVQNTTGTPNFELFVQLMQMKSGYPNNDQTQKTIELTRALWERTSPEDQAHWAQAFEFALASYYEWLTVLETQISQATDPTVLAFQPLVAEFISQVKG